MNSRKVKEYDKVLNWALGMLLLAVFAATVLSKEFHFISLSGLLFFVALGVTFLGSEYEWWVEERFGRAGVVGAFALEWVSYVACAYTLQPKDFLWLLAMPVVSRAVSSLSWPGAVVVCVLYLGSTVWVFGGFKSVSSALSIVLSIGVAYVFTAVCTLAIMRAFDARAQAQRLAAQLEAANTQLQESAAQRAELAAVQERNRIAQDIHDGLGHYLTVVTVQLQAARGLLATDVDRATEALDNAERLTRSALDEVRRSVGSLRESGAAVPLEQALENLIKDCGLPAKLNVEGNTRAVPPAVGNLLFRSVQEGLTNAYKHARARDVAVKLAYGLDGHVSVEVLDDGAGSTSVSSPGFGLLGLRERALALGGSFSAAVRPEGGFRLAVKVPA